MSDTEPIMYPEDSKEWFVGHRILLPLDTFPSDEHPEIRQDGDEYQVVLTQGTKTMEMSFNSGLILTKLEDAPNYVVEVIMPSDVQGVWNMTIELHHTDDRLLYSDTTSFRVPDPGARTVRPWHLIMSRAGRSTPEQYLSRLNICKACDRYHAGICSECGCVMKAKCSLADAVCPIGKW